MKKQILATVLLGAVSAQAIAIEVTGNAGFVTNYIWRGADQSNGKAAAQGGLDHNEKVEEIRAMGKPELTWETTVTTPSGPDPFPSPSGETQMKDDI